MGSNTPGGRTPNTEAKSIFSGPTKGTLPVGKFLFWASVVIIIEMVLLGGVFRALDWLPIGENVVNAAVLGGVLAGSAIAIERIIEFGWTAVGLAKGTGWPLVQVGGNISQLADNLDKSLQPFYSQADKVLKDADTVAKAAPGKIDAATTALSSLQDELQALTNGGKINNEQIKILAATASARIDQISGLGNDLKGGAEVAKQAISVLSSVADGFQDRPGRRLISLFAGMFLGLLVATGVGLDIFQVASEGTTTQVVSNTAQAVTTTSRVTSTTLGVIFTGLVLGLGSSPTHEVIKLVQEVKKNFKNRNATD